jgi:hypothetical protein
MEVKWNMPRILIRIVVAAVAAAYLTLPTLDLFTARLLSHPRSAYDYVVAPFNMFPAAIISALFGVFGDFRALQPLLIVGSPFVCWFVMLMCCFYFGTIMRKWRGCSGPAASKAR